MEDNVLYKEKRWLFVLLEKKKIKIYTEVSPLINIP